MNRSELEELRRSGLPLPGLGVLVAYGSERSCKQEGERIERQLYLLSAASGYCSTKHLIAALKRRSARPVVVNLASELRCSICEERQKTQPTHAAPEVPHNTIAADVGR